ncbi:MAG: ATP-grasp domain-containing protein [Oceanisphaera sp.]|uniref:ATP-grasp domain-containing protein n=1 Tax=Oceanisphaera sp. TaxID=1929979 RepID=UPI003C7496AF
MIHAIWFMTGLSSQRDMIRAIKAEVPEVTIVASHQQPRYEILAEADYAYLEPPLAGYDLGSNSANIELMLVFMAEVVNKHQVSVIHVGRNSPFFEGHRSTIESWGVTLVTGARGQASFAIADNKQAFANHMQAQGLPVVPTLSARSLAELEHIFKRQPFGATDFCIKPARGIYGMGFWHLDTTAVLLDADTKRIHPDIYLAAARLDNERGHQFSEQVVMPFLPGIERSVDIIIDQGKVITAIGRCKKDAVQYFEHSGIAFDLALKCAEQLGLDGLVNVQTRDDANGQPFLLETNLRPSGGICFSLSSKVNLSALFARYVTGLWSAADIQAHVAACFMPAHVRSTSTVLPLPLSLPSLNTLPLSSSIGQPLPDTFDLETIS